MAAVMGGPTPWWQTSPYSNVTGAGLGRGTGALKNLQQSAPEGYEYDPVQMQYTRTPVAAGTRAGEEQAAYLKQLGPAMQGLFGAYGSSSGGGGGTASYSTPTAPSLPGATTEANIPRIDQLPTTYTAPATVPEVQMPDISGAQAEAFGRAKDIAGQTAASGARALSGLMAGRGTVGSGVESHGLRDIVQTGEQQLGEVARQQAIEKAQEAADFAKTGYQGSITQRGQDIEQLTAQAQRQAEMRGQDITQRGQDVQAQQAAAQLQAQLAEAGYTGKVSLRGQDIQNAQFYADLAERQRQQQQQAMMGLMGSFKASY